MRQIVILLGVVLLFACNAGAQANPAYSFSSAVPNLLAANASPSGGTSFSLATPGANSAPTTNFTAVSGIALPDAPAPAAPAEPPQGVQGVFQNFDWQAYIGYTYVRFFEVPGTQLNTDGFNFSVQYFFKDWIAADGEFVATFGSQLGSTSEYLMGMGGVRIRKAMPRGLEVWAHALGGAAHYSPQTAYGKQDSLGYELGGGVDINAHHRRLAYRVAVDAAGTRFFNTYQVSPKVSAGVVFKF